MAKFDLWSVTKSGHAQEHEIKITRSDFFQDAKKSREDMWRRTWGGNPILIEEAVHDRSL